jgi:RNA polymerase sigma factor (sigma-70 family)
MALTRDPLAHPEELIRRVYAYCAYRLGNEADAEDATSDVFERAVRYRDRYDPQKGSPIAWLMGIARRSVEDVRAARPLVTDAESEEVAPHRDSALRLDLASAVAELDQRDRELIALRYGADLKASEIAELLEMKTNAVEVALHRALGRLRKELERKGIGSASSVFHPGLAP